MDVEDDDVANAQGRRCYRQQRKAALRGGGRQLLPQFSQSNLIHGITHTPFYWTTVREQTYFCNLFNYTRLANITGPKGKQTS
nr:hypothetical protein CFP56_27411 [Quercus suber]